MFMANRKLERLRHGRNYVCDLVFTHQTFNSLSAHPILRATNYELSWKRQKTFLAELSNTKKSTYLFQILKKAVRCTVSIFSKEFQRRVN